MNLTRFPEFYSEPYVVNNHLMLCVHRYKLNKIMYPTFSTPKINAVKQP